MSRQGTARDQLQRILFMLPAAGGEGADLARLAESLGVSEEVVVSDLDEVASRAYYHRAGPADALNVYIEADRVRVRTTGDFRRPPKLDPREALALTMGVRVLASERDPETRAGLLDLAERLERDLASVRVEDFRPSLSVEGDGEGEADEFRGRLSDAIDTRRVVVFEYLKANGATPETRTLEPYALVGSAGRWYAIGFDRDRLDVRAFRVDRILDLKQLETEFEEPTSFDLDVYLSGRRVYREDGGVSATIRYAPSISRWILERDGAEEEGDGSAVVEQHVGDTDWAIRHVLQYGGEAELVAPPGLRTKVIAAAKAVVRAHQMSGEGA
jgi:predicted DNA-binding transcriptional regulator YafY